MATIQAKSFKLALVQLGGLGSDKAQNLKTASKAVREAVTNGKADLVVLPVSGDCTDFLSTGGSSTLLGRNTQEIFNSPYAVTAFRQYSEPIPDTFPTKAADLSGSESLVALSKMAKDNNVWLIGGELCTQHANAGVLTDMDRRLNTRD